MYPEREGIKWAHWIRLSNSSLEGERCWISSTCLPIPSRDGTEWIDLSGSVNPGRETDTVKNLAEGPMPEGRPKRLEVKAAPSVSAPVSDPRDCWDKLG